MKISSTVVLVNNTLICAKEIIQEAGSNITSNIVSQRIVVLLC